MEYIGIDYGSKNIGLSWGSDELGTAVPLNAILHFNALEQAFGKLIQPMQEHGCDAFVIGLPLHRDGTEGKRVYEVKKFAQQLHARFSKPIYFQDERFSTQTAKQLSSPKVHSLFQTKKQKNRGIIDSYAAMIILQDFLNSRSQAYSGGPQRGTF